jgi:NAD(P)-dependent dehydrogenase (short-subunit alcohol dehydrogenase family)
MKDTTGKVAFITGGASGIGLGIARAFVGAGMKVVIADIRQEALDAALKSLAAGASVRAVQLDVTDRKAWARAADEAERAFGAVQVLCNNAGVHVGGPVQDATYEDWDFCLGVNLGGVINGIRTFVPRMIRHGQGGHIVNTSSVGGLVGNKGLGVYTTSKFAVTGLSESLRADLTTENIGVSVLCPGPVKSEFFESTMAVRPASLARTGSVTPPLGAERAMTPIFATAMTADEVGTRVLAGIRRNDLYILTHAEIRDMLEARSKALLAALPAAPVDPARIEAGRIMRDLWIYEDQIAKPAP